MAASLLQPWLKTMTGTNFRAQFLWRRNTQREARLQRRNVAGAASVQTDKKHLPQSVQIRRQSSTFPPQIVWILSALQTQLRVQGGGWLPVTRERFEKTLQLDRSPQKEDGGLCLLERKSGVDKRMPGAAVFVSRSHALQSSTNKGNCVLKSQSLVLHRISKSRVKISL